MKVTCLGFQISQELAALSHGTVDLQVDNNGYSEFSFKFETRT